MLIKLNVNKAAQDTDAPVKILEEYGEFVAQYICTYFNDAIISCKFLRSFKLAIIPHIFKNRTRAKKDNYRLVSILPIISNFFNKNYQ